VYRLAAYTAAGADGVFVPGVIDAATISRLAGAVDRPLNILFSPDGPTLLQLAALGVRRVSLGSLLFRAGLAAVTRTADNIRRGRSDLPPDLPTYDDVQSLVAG
jgi:2-methylisocitrate lyase-like PEP mutase family enzyme